MKITTKTVARMCLVLTLPAITRAELTPIPFDKAQWNLDQAEVVNHLGRTAIQGTAKVKDIIFKNGIVEFDLAISGERSYPGVSFRAQARKNSERFYIRPHRAGLYPDALQYAPSFGGVVGWQLYHGEGTTGGHTFKHDRWFNVRIEVCQSQARVLIDNVEIPAIEIKRLKHGISQGGLELSGPRNDSAYFSNFRYELTDELEFKDVPKEKTSPEAITNWDLARFPKNQSFDPTEYPEAITGEKLKWTRVVSEPSGLINISRTIPRTSRDVSRAIARTVIHTDDSQQAILSFGYSDNASIFLNNRIIFAGKSGYHSRDPSFLGLIGLHDTIPLRLNKGRNELLLVVSETFGGWGFIGHLERPEGVSCLAPD